MDERRVVVIKSKRKKDIEIPEYSFDNIESIKAKYAVEERKLILPNQFELDKQKDGTYQCRIIDEGRPSEEQFNNFLYESNFLRLEIPRTFWKYSFYRRHQDICKIESKIYDSS